MQLRWKAAHVAFILATGGEPHPSPKDFPLAFCAREEAEAALVAEYHRRVASLSHELKDPV